MAERLSTRFRFRRSHPGGICDRGRLP